MSEPLPRLILAYGTRDLAEFERVAEAAAASLSDAWAVRMVVSHLAAKDVRQRTDPGDPYLEYSANFPDIFHFVVPESVRPEIDPAVIGQHLELADRKVAILERLGIGGAFLGREPAYLPERLLARVPHWRGPRVDHPRRSRNPVFAPCFHQPEVEALYREAAEALVRRLPAVDSFYWWTNDSGSGFCWYPYSYPGANGPIACRAAGPIPALAAFHAAVLDGARAGGAAEPISIMTQTRIWDQARMPAGAYRYPPDEAGIGVSSIHSDLSLTYPIRTLWDPHERLEQIRAMARRRPVATIWWLSEVYGRGSIDAASAVRQVRLMSDAGRAPEALEHTTGRVGLLRALAAAEFGAPAADDVVDAWGSLHDAFTIQARSPFRRPLVRFLPTYGPVSHRWLTRPLVAFPGELRPDEEDWFLPHVFALGDEARRTNLLDVHGYQAVEPGEAHDLRSAYFGHIESALQAAADAFDRAARRAPGQTDLHGAAISAHLLASIWASTRNWLEFAALRRDGAEGATAPGDAGALEAAEAYRRAMFAVVRAELDNTVEFQRLLGDDPDGLLVRAVRPEDEDTFLLAPDLQAQLTRKREVMLAHWQDVARLVPRPAP